MASDTQVIFSMMRVGKIHPPNKQVLKDISLGFYYGAKIGVLGLNGAGKSTSCGSWQARIRITSVRLPFQRLYLGLMEQEPVLDENKTVIEVIREAVQPIVDLLAEYDAVNEAFADPEADFEKLIEKQGKLQDQLDHHDAWNLDSHLELAMEALRCPPADTPIRVLSGGERRRVALTKILLEEPDVLLLDEPTNHLDAESVAWLERHLQNYKGTVIAVTHDRYFLDNVAEWILELDRGEGIPWKGNYSSWLEQKQERLRVEEKPKNASARCACGLDHVSSSAGKGQARVTAYEKLLSQEHEKVRRDLEIFIPSGPRLGDVVIELEGISKRYGDRVLFDNLDLSVPPGSIVGVIGPNGTGKSTLIKIIANLLAPDSGSVRLGETVKLGYADQFRTLDPEATVFEEITGGADNLQLGEVTVNGRAYCSSFNFTGSDQQKAIKTLSGGERNRVFLAKTLTVGANVLLLDEPTNDLDVNTLRAGTSLEEFAGSAVVVSHDRWFLDRIATHILALEKQKSQSSFWATGLTTRSISSGSSAEPWA